jgi:hypothetical protein
MERIPETLKLFVVSDFRRLDNRGHSIAAVPCLDSAGNLPALCEPRNAVKSRRGACASETISLVR